MAGVHAKGGKKNRKHGKNLRKPSMLRYKAANRYEQNKARKAKRQARIQARCRSRLSR